MEFGYGEQVFLRLPTRFVRGDAMVLDRRGLLRGIRNVEQFFGR